jgi:hypothetical protein
MTKPCGNPHTQSLSIANFRMKHTITLTVISRKYLSLIGFFYLKFLLALAHPLLIQIWVISKRLPTAAPKYMRCIDLFL